MSTITGCRICQEEEFLADREMLIWEGLGWDGGLATMAAEVASIIGKGEDKGKSSSPVSVLAGLSPEEMYRHYRFHQTKSPEKRSERSYAPELLDEYYALTERERGIIGFVSKARVVSPRVVLEVYYPTDELTNGKLDRVGRELRRLAVKGWLGRFTARGPRPPWSVIHGRNLYTLGPRGAAVLEHLTGRWRPYRIDELTLHHDLMAAWAWTCIHKYLDGAEKEWGPWAGELSVPTSSYDGTISIGYWDGEKERDQLPDGIGQVVWKAKEYWMPAMDPRLLAGSEKGLGKGLDKGQKTGGYNYPHPRVWNAYAENLVEGIMQAGEGDIEGKRIEVGGVLPAPLRGQHSLPFFIEYDNGSKKIEEVAQQLFGYYHMRESVGRVFPQLGSEHMTEYGEEMGLPVFMIMDDTDRVGRVRQEMIKQAPAALVKVTEMGPTVPGIWLTTQELFTMALEGSRVIVHGFSDLPAYDFWQALIMSSYRSLQSPFMNGNDLLIDRKQARRITGGKGFVS